MIDLTQKQTNVLLYIKTYVEQYQGPPTYREIGGAMKCTTKTAYNHVKALIRKGFVGERPGSNRSLRILKLPVAREDL